MDSGVCVSLETIVRRQGVTGRYVSRKKAFKTAFLSEGLFTNELSNLMLIIEHRKNTIEELKAVPRSNGVEIDIRSYGDRLVLHHDPFCTGTDFEEWLEHYNQSFIILNIKEEGLERRVQALVEQKGVRNYFYLDLSFPFIVKLVNAGQKNIAVRFSEYESIDTCLSLAGKVEWVWVDCFSLFPLNKEVHRELSKHFKICLVSPELVGREDGIHSMQQDIRGLKIDAVCTKKTKVWGKYQQDILRGN